MTHNGLRAVYESKYQEWTIVNGSNGSCLSSVHGLELGDRAEIEALQTAIILVDRCGVPLTSSSFAALAKKHGA